MEEMIPEALTAKDVDEMLGLDEEFIKSHLYKNYTNIQELTLDDKRYPIEFEYFPNYVERSQFNHRVLCVGKIIAKVVVDGEEHIAEAKNSIKEPFIRLNGEFVSAARLLKQFDITYYGGKLVKLSKLKGRLFTPTGRTIAEERHAFMVGFFERMDAEVRGKQ